MSIHEPTIIDGMDKAAAQAALEITPPSATDTVTIAVRKGSVGTIAKGAPCYISGYNVGGWVEVEEADSDDIAKMPVIGIANASITNAATSIIVQAGQITGLATSSWSVGDPLYVSTTVGTLTNVKPTGMSAGIQKVAQVLRSHISAGVIQVFGAGRVNDVPNIINLVAPSADVTVGGTVETDVVGENVAFGDILYMKSDGKWWKSDADAAATMPALRMAAATISADASGVLLVAGRARNDAWAWTVGGIIYASTTAGEITQTAPSGSADIVQVVGVAYHADKMIFNPSMETVEIQ